MIENKNDKVTSYCSIACFKNIFPMFMNIQFTFLLAIMV